MMGVINWCFMVIGGYATGNALISAIRWANRSHVRREAVERVRRWDDFASEIVLTGMREVKSRRRFVGPDCQVIFEQAVTVSELGRFRITVEELEEIGEGEES